MPRRPRIASVLAVAVVGILASGSVAAPVTAPQVPDRYYPLDGNVGYDVRHYAIHDRYRFADRHLSGATRIRMVPSTRLTEFNLDLLLRVEEVKVDGVPADFAKFRRHELRVTPANPLEADEPVSVLVRYSGFPERAEYLGHSNWLASDEEVVTMHEPHMAPWWFPSNDHPSDKARFDIRITTGKGRDVISNGVRMGRVVHGRTATTHWRMADPMTTYLAYFAAGDFAIERGEAAGFSYVNAVSKQLSDYGTRRGLAALRRSAEITAWLEEELGDYPFANTGGLVTSLPVGFALENQTRPTYGGAPPTWLLVHELAHQWFGDSVSVARWRDIWLNEGFATYMEARYEEAHGRRTTDQWLHRTYESHPGPRFWRLDISDPGPNRLFAGVVYTRGGITLAALRNRIGTADFEQLLRLWLSTHENANARVGQFETMAETVSGEELDEFFEAWLRSGVRPDDTEANGL